VSELKYRPAQPSLIGQYAGFASRMAAFTIDVTIVSVIIIAVNWLISATLRMLQLQPLLYSLTGNRENLAATLDFLFGPAVYSLLTLTFIILYYVFFWCFGGQTPGKAAMGLRVVPLRGGRIRVSQAIFRYIGYYISGFAFGLGFFWILIDDQRLTWHDKLAKTCVIYAWDARPDERFLADAMQKFAARREALQRLVGKHPRSGQELLAVREPDAPQEPLSESVNAQEQPTDISSLPGKNQTPPRTNL
jgi:uncharacterized RDD family membrane protein YckC